MYSPKISEDLVPLIYRAAKIQKVPMTHWVNEVLKQALVKSSEERSSVDISGAGDTSMNCDPNRSVNYLG